MEYDIIKGKKNKYDVLKIDAFLTGDECDQIRQSVQLSGSKIIKDRHKTLVYNHKVWRIERSRWGWQPLYDKIISTAQYIDRSHWNKLQGRTYTPECEYILYQFNKNKPLPSIEPHVDNGSLISMVVMLTESHNYEGGVSYFQGRPPRKIKLQMGDAVFFRGNKTEHWISDVTKGTRDILQIELSVR